MHATAVKPNSVEIEKLHAEMERKQAEQDAFVMPDTSDGEAVIFYEHGVRSPRHSVAFVQKRNAKGVELRLAGGLVRPNVPHIDDPRLKYSHEMRADWGGWDQSNWKKSLDTTIVDLKSRIAALEEYINSPVTDKKK